ncbi:prolyl-tRNA synthetase [Synechococcus sp. WH 8109]|uniref:proline--tRNA ligase n=1 Tax=Synechococcus sp. WH 8109 TaxID=166314 RepID=UPI0003DFF3F9|nr:proline--tRNA ligase [Synechococcus sp. WH 8109]AHF63141.1 prolyl-tRNA synthetase [Synechococcus sp. WH 8109]
MRVSRLLLVTLRDIPAEAEITSHQLLLRAGYIRRVGSGIYAYLPLMWRVLQKITAVVREEMNRAGAQETLLPQLHPAELWQKSGRWQGYTAGEGIMFHLEDRQGRELGIGPTHEEVITSLAGELLRSYRQLPVNLYQIQTKFRDEIRPRFGLMRGREFIMKDAYSFHASEADLRETYGAMDQAYRRIFERCGLDAVPVDADSGAIGGAASQEFMVTADAGEDLILISDDGQYAANQEKAVSIPSAASPLPDGPEESIPTPGLGSIESLCNAKGWDPSQVVKVLLFVATLDDETLQPLLVSLRGDQELNPTKVVNAVSQTLNKGVLDCSPITPQDNNRQQIDPLPFGSIGPDLSDDVLQGAKTWEPTFLRLADATASELGSFICGANKPDLHRFNTSWTAIGQKPTRLDLRNARAGDVCQHNPKSRLTEKRGIEVGHIFQLGRKYSQAMESRFTNENGKTEPFWMGCYGIGVSRLAQAAVEQHHDDSGICWPTAIAPFEAIVVVANIQDDIQAQLGEALYAELQAAGVDVLLDDRKERAGVKFKDADLIGIPWRIVVGRDASEGTVELVCRSSREVQKLPHAEAVTCLIKALHP